MGEKEFQRRESSEEAKNFQLKRFGGSVFDLIFEERVGHVQAMMGNGMTFTQGTGKIPKAGQCRTCRKMAGWFCLAGA